jgi:hypothetical protein
VASYIYITVCIHVLQNMFLNEIIFSFILNQFIFKIIILQKYSVFPLDLRNTFVTHYSQFRLSVKAHAG